jgi:hypothetical protein
LGVSYADLAAFQVVEGLSYAFSRTTARIRRDIPRLLALRDQVARRPRLLRYLTSPRRLLFNEQGIFWHYPELDGEERIARRAGLQSSATRRHARRVNGGRLCGPEPEESRRRAGGEPGESRGRAGGELESRTRSVPPTARAA